MIRPTPQTAHHDQRPREAGTRSSAQIAHEEPADQRVDEQVGAEVLALLSARSTASLAEAFVWLGWWVSVVVAHVHEGRASPVLAASEVSRAHVRRSTLAHRGAPRMARPEGLRSFGPVFQTILIGYDDPERGGEAIALAETLRDPHTGTLLLTSVYPPAPLPVGSFVGRRTSKCCVTRPKSCSWWRGTRCPTGIG